MALSTLVSSVLSGISLTHILAVIVVSLTVVYWLMTRNFGKFEAKGLKSIKPEFFYGNAKPLLHQTKALMDFHREMYEAFPDEK